MTKNKPTIQSVFRLLGALLGYTAVSLGCLFMGNYSKGIFIDIALGLLVIVLTYGLFNLGIYRMLDRCIFGFIDYSCVQKGRKI